MKYHLVKTLVHDVVICSESTPNIMQASHNDIYKNDKKKEEMATTNIELPIDGVARSSRSTCIFGNNGIERDSMNSPSMRTSHFFVPRMKDVEELSIRLVVKRRSKK